MDMVAWGVRGSERGFGGALWRREDMWDTRGGWQRPFGIFRQERARVRIMGWLLIRFDSGIKQVVTTAHKSMEMTFSRCGDFGPRYTASPGSARHWPDNALASGIPFRCVVVSVISADNQPNILKIQDLASRL